MPKVKFESRSREITVDSTVESYVMFGSKMEIDEAAAGLRVGSSEIECGTLKSIRIFQSGGPDLWCLEVKYERTSDGSVASTSPEDNAYGKKSAHLHGSCLSLPLEAHPGYRTVWNHYLAVKPGEVAGSTPWDEKTDIQLTDEEAQKYAWVKDPSELPVDASGRWHTEINREIPGVDAYDVPVYTIVISAKFKTAEKAGSMIAGKLNTICTPNPDFGLSAGGYNWKVDDATVQWTGKYWLATLTYTRFCNTAGWNRKLYPN